MQFSINQSINESINQSIRFIVLSQQTFYGCARTRNVTTKGREKISTTVKER